MIDIVWDYSANAPDWDAVLAAIAAISATIFLIAYLRHRRIDQADRTLRDCEEQVTRLENRIRELEVELKASQSEYFKLQSANLQLQTDHLKDMRQLTDSSRQDISMAADSREPDFVVGALEQLIDNLVPDETDDTEDNHDE